MCIRDRCNPSKDTSNGKVSWLKIKQFRFIRGSSNVMFKYNPGDSFSELDISKNKLSATDLNNFRFTKGSCQRIPISVAKKKDLLNLVKKGIIPPIYAQFYQNLPTNKKVKDVAVWVSEEEAEEDEELLVLELEDIPT